MDRALAIVEPDEATKELVREAGELADGVGADLVLLYVTTEDEFNERLDTIAEVTGSDTSYYNVGKAKEGAKQFAEEVGREVFADTDVEFEAIGAVGDLEDEIFAVAEEEGCDHIFIRGKKRSPTGKAIFGDLAQTVILEFDGAVTVVTT